MPSEYLCLRQDIMLTTFFLLVNTFSKPHYEATGHCKEGMEISSCLYGIQTDSLITLCISWIMILQTEYCGWHTRKQCPLK